MKARDGGGKSKAEAKPRGSSTSKASANASNVKDKSAEEDDKDKVLTKAGRRMAKNSTLSQTVIDLANSDPISFLATKVENSGAPSNTTKSDILQKDLEQMKAAGTFAESVLEAQRKEIEEAKTREERAAKQAISNWRLPQQANQRLLRLQADIEGKHTKSIEDFKQLEDDATAKIKALRIQLDEAQRDRELEEKAYQDKINKVKLAIDLLPTAFGKQKQIEEQLEADKDMGQEDISDTEAADQEDVSPPATEASIPADKVKFILEEALRQANFHTNGNIELQNGLTALMGGIVNAITAATTMGPANKSSLKRRPRTSNAPIPLDSDTDGDSGMDMDLPTGHAKRSREYPSDLSEDEDNIYPWDKE